MLGRKTVSVIMLFLLLIGVFSLAVNIKPVKSAWTGTVYIRADGRIDPPDAPIITYDNITYTLTDNITSSGDGIVVERSNVIIDGAGYTIQGTGEYPYKGISLKWRINVTIRNAQIQNFYYGIHLDSSLKNTISGNNITNNSQGIVLIFSSNNSISGNTFADDGLIVGYSYHNVVVNNTVNGKPLVYLEDVANYSVGDAGQVILVNCDGIRVENLNLSGTDVGVQLWGTRNSVIGGNNMINNGWSGIWLTYSSNNNIISGNNITANNWTGVYLGSSSNNILSGNNITNNNIGVGLWSSSNNILSGNNITNNSDGIRLIFSSNNNIISGNNITANNREGLGLDFSSDHNIIRGNNITNNEKGVRIFGSFDNWFYHNNFIDNSVQVYNIVSINVWDDGYPSGGNYWSDYKGVDRYIGPYQNESGIDDIGDIPYVIDENNVDHYPLMSPWVPPSPVTVDIDPDTLNLESKGRWITAYIQLPEGYNISDINIASIMLKGTISADLTAPYEIGDYNNDGIPDLMVSFNRTAVSELILSLGIKYGKVKLTVTGRLYEGTEFKGSDTIKVRMPGDINIDGKVDIKDTAIVSKAFGSYPGHPKWNYVADENEDNVIDIFDIALISRNFGKTYT